VIFSLYLEKTFAFGQGINQGQQGAPAILQALPYPQGPRPLCPLLWLWPNSGLTADSTWILPSNWGERSRTPG
jgi:hypothetical protein